MARPDNAAEAFRLLQAGDHQAALEAVQRALSVDPSNARAHVAGGIALRMAGRLAEARAALARARQLDPRDHAAAYEAGLAAQLMGDAHAAQEAFERSAELRPEFFPAHFAAGLVHADQKEWAQAQARFRRVLELRPGDPHAQLQLAFALVGSGNGAQAEAAFAHVLATHPHDAAIVRACGQRAASQGDFSRAGELFSQALRLQPGDPALSMYLAQCELLVGRWAQGWVAYAAREPRRQFEQSAAARGTAYVVPTLEDLRGGVVTLVGEQGLGDTLFFLRWAPALREAGVRIRFSGDTRLHPLLGRTGLFDALEPQPARSGRQLLAGDLPLLFPEMDPYTAASLRIAPLADRIARWKAILDASGPRPWTGLAWRAGTPPEDQPYALSKSVPIDKLFGSVAAEPGTLVAIQRAVRAGEIDAAKAAAGRDVVDASRANDDLEDVLALVSLLDRHIAVSSTTIHLAAAAGAVVDVLVPFPPEWRWRAQGDSPWFPGFRVHRQGVDGDWSAALMGAARGVQATGLQ
jgi:tetratricopeptide (TPR) repeat protein